MPSTSSPTRPLLSRAEFWLGLLLTATAVYARYVLRAPMASFNYQLYYKLGSCFVSGGLGAVLVVYAERLLMTLPHRTWKRVHTCWLGLVCGLTTLLLLTVHPPRASELSRLMESTLLSLIFANGLLAFVLPLLRVLQWRHVLQAAREVLGMWGLFLLYLAIGGMYTNVILMSTPLLYDPVLLRMDVSLGFSPTEAVYHWVKTQAWTDPFNRWGYPMLGGFMAVVAARLHIARDLAHCRRCLLALACVGSLGMMCYRLVPAICPSLAFPQLFEKAVRTPERQAQADAQRQAILSGPRLLPADTTHPRNVMPSLHTTFSLVALAAAWSWRRGFFWYCLPIGAVQILTTMTLSVHYLVDLFAAVPLAALCWWLGDQGVRRWPLPQHDPLPSLKRQSGRDTALFFSALTLSVLGFLLWGWLAPIPPWVAWPLALLCTVGPAWACIRLHQSGETD